MSCPKGDKVPCARLCHLVKWEDFEGYGFNLQTEKGKEGQFIGSVEEGSPSQAAGLKEGDRVVEVNEINVASESHKQVVERIKAFPNTTKLLVVDKEADEYFRANNIVIEGTMANLKVIACPETNPNTTKNEERSDAASNASAEEGTQKSTGSNDASSQQSENSPTPTTTRTSSESTTRNDAEDTARENGNGIGSDAGHTARIGSDVAHAPSVGNGSVASSETSKKGLDLTMSAKELRAKLAARKKYDPKKESIGFKDKFDIVQEL